MRLNSFLPLWLTGVMTVTLTIRPGLAETTNLAAVADTSLHSVFPDNNFGGATTFIAGGGRTDGAGGRARALLRFDIAGRLPAGATINSVQLTLTVNNVNGPNSTFDLHRVLAGWGEGAGNLGLDRGTGAPAAPGDATWNHRQSSAAAWTTAGGDYHVTSSGSQLVSGLGSYTFSGPGLAADVQMWLDHPESDFGWLLRSQAENTPGTIRRFAGRTSEANVPQLVVDYTVGSVSPVAPPELSDVARVGNGIRFSFQAQASTSYTVEFRDDLSGTNWTVLTNIPALLVDTTLHITNEVAGLERYFRVRTP